MHHATSVEGRRVAVHCHAGLGRTGLAIACFLLYSRTAASASAAIAAVRSGRPGALQTAAQVLFVSIFEQYLSHLMCLFKTVDPTKMFLGRKSFFAARASRALSRMRSAGRSSSSSGGGSSGSSGGGGSEAAAAAAVETLLAAGDAAGAAAALGAVAIAPPPGDADGCCSSSSGGGGGGAVGAAMGIVNSGDGGAWSNGPLPSITSSSAVSDLAAAEPADCKHAAAPGGGSGGGGACSSSAPTTAAAEAAGGMSNSAAVAAAAFPPPPLVMHARRLSGGGGSFKVVCNGLVAIKEDDRPLHVITTDLAVTEVYGDGLTIIRAAPGCRDGGAKVEQQVRAEWL
jgi:hypothetical protein